MSEQASPPPRATAAELGDAHDGQEGQHQPLRGPKAASPPSRQSPYSPRSPVDEVQNSTEAETRTATSDDGYETESHYAASTSLSSSVRDYVFENNRRYHKFKEGRYLIPNDEPEQEREDMKHAMIVNLCEGALHLAPLENPHKILDVGTGTGIWVVDMGDEYPEAEIIGNDLSPIQPNWVPPNVRFQVDDAEAEWVYGPNTLDLVHARHMCMAIKDWPRLVGQAYEALKPGGWIELQELRFSLRCDDDSMPADYGYGKFVRLCLEGFSKFGINPLSMERNAELLTEGGFINVQEKVWKVPIGIWPKDPRIKTVGLYNRSMLLDALQGVSMAPLTRGLGWSSTEVEVFLVEVRKSLMNSSIHSYLTFHIVIGQKPGAGT